MAQSLCFSLFLIYAAFSSVSAISREEKMGQKYINRDDARRMKNLLSKRGPGQGKEWVYMPDGDGNPQLAILKHGNTRNYFWEDNTVSESEGSPPRNLSEEVKFHLYTRSNPKKGFPISLENQKSLKSARYDSNKPTKFVIHGWLSNGDSTTVRNIKDSYLKKSDVNVVGVDWSSIAGNNFYYTPMSEVPNVGERVAKMVDLMVTSQGARHEDFHIVGHSLGAHVAGAAGQKTSRKLSRITGLDPALPGFEYWETTDGRLDKTDAEFVDVVHTCAGILGMSNTVGHADFYPNGGTPFQPGCCCLPEITDACSHGRAHVYFAESIVNDVPFRATPCNTWDDFKEGRCGKTFVDMGQPTKPTTRGIYYLMTNSSAPFALGPTGTKYFESDRK